MLSSKCRCLAGIWIVTIFATCATPTLAIAQVKTPNFTLSVIDAETQASLPARVYLTDANQKAFYVQASNPGYCVPYTKQNWINKNSTEYHTTVVGYPCHSVLPAGDYTLVVECGKSYFPESLQFQLEESEQVRKTISMRRWNSPAERGWYSGDTHLHRTIEELKNVLLAEDLNVALPLTNWVTIAEKPPSTGDKNLAEIPDDLIEVDKTHLIWPRNTEYEIFSVGGKRHTLGALFVLGHREPIQTTVPPWKPVIQSLANRDNVFFDMDKLDWPFAMLLPSIATGATYELANNHVWRTEFAFRKWNSPAPNFMQPPYGQSQGGHRQWLDYTFGMYYTLLNTGLRLPPSAGTANGVHPVPAGFGRVYVHLPDGFSLSNWIAGLKAGRSFVTTGPMLYATLDGEAPGKEFESKDAGTFELKCELKSEKRLAYGEVILNGQPITLLRPQNKPLDTGAFSSNVKSKVEVPRSGWVAVRFWEPRPDGQSRFVHSAPWYVEVAGRPTEILQDEKDYLLSRIKNEIARSKDVISDQATQEYVRAVEFYESLPVFDETAEIAEHARPLQDDRVRWLENMILDHRFSEHEIRRATGLSLDDARKEIQERNSTEPPSGFRIRPYPGGRHPRRGFLDGALNPQRETKVSVFAPWEDGGYVVIDAPEAVFSNLGLTYLAHTHIPSIWADQELQKLEWSLAENLESMTLERTLPNGIQLTSSISCVTTRKMSGVQLHLTLRNGTNEELTGLRVQICTMLKGTIGFNDQERLQSVERPPFVAIRSQDGPKWIITACTPNHRCWTNPPVPCVHSDPVFPNCPAGETVHIDGGLWFYEGDDVIAEIEQLDRLLEGGKLWE